MNLAALAQFVCSKVRHTDSASIALCKGYLTARFQMIWDDALWRESLVCVTTTLDPTNATANYGLDALGVWLLPAIAQKVVALRDHERAYFVRNQEEYFRIDPDQFGQQGTAVEFNLLPSCVLAFGSAMTLYCRPVDPSDKGSSFTARTLGVNLSFEENTATLPDDTQGQLLSNQDAIELSTYTKAITSNFVEIGYVQGGTTLVPITDMAAADTAMAQRRRIQIVQLPQKAVNLRALVKRTIPPFTNDADVPQLPALENVLIAYAQADMLQQSRQYAKAQLLQQEAAGLMMEAKKLEVYQQANSPRFIPAAEPTWDQDFAPNQWYQWLRGPSV